MSDSIYSVSPYSGATFRLFICDCEGTLLTASDVDSIQYSVFRKDLGAREPVEGHFKANVPLSSIFSEPQISADLKKEFNFEYRISGASMLPFAEPDSYYLVVFTFFVDGEPYVCQIQVLSE